MFGYLKIYIHILVTIDRELETLVSAFDYNPKIPRTAESQEWDRVSDSLREFGILTLPTGTLPKYQG